MVFKIKLSGGTKSTDGVREVLSNLTNKKWIEFDGYVTTTLGFTWNGRVEDMRRLSTMFYNVLFTVEEIPTSGKPTTVYYKGGKVEYPKSRCVKVEIDSPTSELLDVNIAEPMTFTMRLVVLDEESTYRTGKHAKTKSNGAIERASNFLTSQTGNNGDILLSQKLTLAWDTDIFQQDMVKLSKKLGDVGIYIEQDTHNVLFINGEEVEVPAEVFPIKADLYLGEF